MTFRRLIGEREIRAQPRREIGGAIALNGKPAAPLRPARQWDIWHDRAVFHFLTRREAQDAYIAALKAATRPGAAVILSTFAPDGPERCSGLPVQRYGAADLAARLGADFALADQAAERHVTPWGSIQSFTCAAFRRV